MKFDVFALITFLMADGTAAQAILTKLKAAEDAAAAAGIHGAMRDISIIDAIYPDVSALAKTVIGQLAEEGIKV